VVGHSALLLSTCINQRFSLNSYTNIERHIIFYYQVKFYPASFFLGSDDILKHFMKDSFQIQVLVIGSQGIIKKNSWELTFATP
jgi:hypothetical protein